MSAGGVRPGKSLSGGRFRPGGSCLSVSSKIVNMLLHVTLGRWRSSSGGDGEFVPGEYVPEGLFVRQFGVRRYVINCYMWTLKDNRGVRPLGTFVRVGVRSGVFVRQFGIRQFVITCYTWTLNNFGVGVRPWVFVREVFVRQLRLDKVLLNYIYSSDRRRRAA